MPAEPACPVALFWKFPLEVREEIYYYALFQPPEYNTAEGFLRTVEAPRLHGGWWAIEHMTPIFNVNRQIRDEAELVLYSRFKFCFPNDINMELVHRVQNSMDVRARNHLRRIGVFYTVIAHPIPQLVCPAPYFEWNEHQFKEALSLLVELLPGLREVELTIAFVGTHRPEDQFEEVVEVALRIASPLKYVEKLRVYPADPGVHRLRIFRDVAERVRNRSW